MKFALNAAAQNVRLGRHRNSWEHIQDTPCEVPVGQWVRLEVKLEGPDIEIFVNDRSVLKYEDGENGLLAGMIGLRQFQAKARYRNLWVKTNNEKHFLAFRSDGTFAGEVSEMWRPIRTGDASGEWKLDGDSPFVGC